MLAKWHLRLLNFFCASSYWSLILVFSAKSRFWFSPNCKIGIKWPNQREKILKHLRIYKCSCAKQTCFVIPNYSPTTHTWRQRNRERTKHNQSVFTCLHVCAGVHMYNIYVQASVYQRFSCHLTLLLTVHAERFWNVCNHWINTNVHTIIYIHLRVHRKAPYLSA